MRNLIQAPHSFLGVHSQPITDFDHWLEELVADMTSVSRGIKPHPGVGISAVQVGECVRAGIIEMDWGKKRWGPPLVICNPEVLDMEGVQNNDEGCLSLPGQFFTFKRPQIVRARFQDIKGNTKTSFFHGIFARCILHEIDHMEGILVTHRHKEQQ